MNNYPTSGSIEYTDDEEIYQDTDQPESYTEEASPYGENSDYESLLQLKETLEQTGALFDGTLGELNDEEQEQLYSEILPALLPILTSVAPAVIQGVSSLIAKRRRRPAGVRRHPQVQKGPSRIQRRPPVRQQAPTRTQPKGATQRGGTRALGTINQLLSLVSNPQVMQLLRRAASGGLREGILVQDEQVIVPFRSVLSAIHEFSGEALSELSKENITENPSYLLNKEGEYRCDPENIMERAEIVQELLSKVQ